MSELTGMIDIFSEALQNENKFIDNTSEVDRYIEEFDRLARLFIQIKTSNYHNVNNNYFKELCKLQLLNRLYFSRFALYHLLKSVDPSDITIKTELNNFLFSDNPDENCIKIHLNFDFFDWNSADYDVNLQLTPFKGLTKSSMELMKKTYDKYFKIKELFDSNEISKLSEYSNLVDEFIRIQPVENLQKYLTNLDGIYTGLYSEKTESTASELKKRITNLVVGELDNFFRSIPLDENKITYISRYIKLDDIFFPFIASYTESEFIELEKKVQGTSMQKLFNPQVIKAKEKYKSNHELYLTKVDGKIKDLQSKLTLDDYGLAKQLLTNANKLTKELQTSYTRFLQITNIYDEKGKDEFKIKLKEHITTLQTILKKIVEKEAFLKDKEFNSKQKKDHQFTLGIELLTNVQGNEKLKYTPDMTVPSGAGDSVYFTPKRAMHQNTIESIPPGKPPEYKYIQLTKLPDFNSLLTRLSSAYFLEADEPFDEYSKVSKKKNDDLTKSNINIVLDTLFYTGSPFYIGSERYTTFSYDLENGVEKITKNDKKETYGDEDDDSVIKGLTGPTSIKWPWTLSGPTVLSKPPSSFSSEMDEVGTIYKSDELTRDSTVDNSEEKEVGTIYKSDELTRNSTVDNSEASEVGTMYKSDELARELTRDSTVDNSEQQEVGTIYKSNELTRDSAVDNSEEKEVGTIYKSDVSRELARDSTVNNNEQKEVGLGLNDVASGIENPTSRSKIIDKSEENEAGFGLASDIKTMPDILKRDSKSVYNSEENEVDPEGVITTTTINPILSAAEKEKEATITKPEDSNVNKGIETTNPNLSAAENEKEVGIDDVTLEEKEEITKPEDSNVKTEEVNPPDVTITKPEDSNVNKGIETTNPILSAAENKEEKKEDILPSKNTDRTKNTDYMKRLLSSQDEKFQDKFLKLLRLEQTKDVNAINFTSIIDEPMSGGNQVGGANALYIDLDQETTLYSQKKRELENEVKKLQEDELALLSKQSEDLNKDETIQEVKWKYFVTVELHLYPGDHIPLSAYASLACSKKSNDIYNIWQNIMTKIKNPDSKEKYKKKMLAYTPVIPNKTVKNKDTELTKEPSNNNNKTVKARDSTVKP